jgi:RimJ/RimL family protein N-acetyltransferase
VTTNVFDFSPFPVLTTKRLALCKLLHSDAVDLLVFRGDWEVQKYNGPVAQNEDDVLTLIEEAHAEYATQTGIGWAVALTEGDKVMGLFGFHD